MGRFLAVDWDQREVRCAVATSAAGHLRILSLAAVPLAGPAEADGSQPDAGEALRQLVAQQHTGRATVLVGVDRGHVEVIDLNLPPAKDSELAELVLLQAMRETPTITEESALDFLPMTTDPTQPRKVRAAVLSAEQMEHIRQVCTAAGVKPRRLVLRSFALASLFARTAVVSETAVMLVDRIGDEVELVVVVDGRPTLLRTFRLPASGGEEKAVQRLITEVRRTATVAMDEQTSAPIQCVYLVGRAEEQEPLAQRIRDEASLAADVFDPFEAMKIPEALVPPQPQRFAPLLGMLLDEVHGAAHPVDFLNPRRGRQRPNRRRTLALALAALVVAMFVGGDFVSAKLAEVDATNRELESELRDLKKAAKKLGEQNKVVDAVRDWLAGDVNWLDELRDLSIRFPTARDMILLRTSMASTPRAGGGEVILQGVVRDPLVVSRMETNVRDKYHELSSKRVQERIRDKTYSWHFETSISVAKRTKNQYTSHLPSTLR